MALFSGASNATPTVLLDQGGNDAHQSQIPQSLGHSGSAFLADDLTQAAEAAVAAAERKAAEDEAAVTATQESPQEEEPPGPDLASAVSAAAAAAAAVASAVSAAELVGSRNRKSTHKKRQADSETPTGDVRVGDRVEVRDARDEEWESGVVTSVEVFPDPEKPDQVIRRVYVTKDGWDRSFEWDICRIEVPDYSDDDEDDEDDEEEEEEEEE